jgi:hypothetical protein
MLRLVNIMLLLVVLIGASKLHVFKNTCPMSNEVSYDLAVNTCCCTGESVDEGCCDTELVVLQADLDYLQEYHSLTLLQVSPFLAINKSLQSFVKSPIKYFENLVNIKPPPLILAGREILCKNQVYLI